MKKATFIKPEDLQQLEFDENGNIIIPEGFEIYIKEDPEHKRLERIAELEATLGEEPTDEELINLGKQYSSYYLYQDEIAYLKGGN